MSFAERYTTTSLKDADKALPEKDQTEQKKVIVSEEAFLNAKMLEEVCFRISRIGNG